MPGWRLGVDLAAVSSCSLDRQMNGHAQGPAARTRQLAHATATETVPYVVGSRDKEQAFCQDGVDEKPSRVEAWGVEVLVTDDLGSYRQVARQLHTEHRICHFYMRRWVGRRRRGLQRQLDATWRTSHQQRLGTRDRQAQSPQSRRARPQVPCWPAGDGPALPCLIRGLTCDHCAQLNCPISSTAYGTVSPACIH